VWSCPAPDDLTAISEAILNGCPRQRPEIMFARVLRSRIAVHAVRYSSTSSGSGTLLYYIADFLIVETIFYYILEFRAKLMNEIKTAMKVCMSRHTQS
jgi:hypothetical protein